MKELARERWAEFFRSIMTTRERLLATVEVVGEHADVRGVGLSAQTPLRAISYAPETDLFLLEVGSHDAPGPALRYFVSAPRAISVSHDEESTAILIADASGARTVVCLFRSLTLRGSPLRRRCGPGACGELLLRRGARPGEIRARYLRRPKRHWTVGGRRSKTCTGPAPARPASSTEGERA